MLTPDDRDIHSGTPSRLLDAVPPAVIGVPVVCLPWIFGGVQPAVYWWLLAGIAAALLLALFSIRHQNASLIVPAALVPLLLAGGLGALQILPLPAQLVDVVAPRNGELWQQQTTDDLGGKAPGSGAAEPAALPHDYLTISLYPASTRRDLALLLGAVSLFAIGARFLSRSTALLLLLGIAAVDGAAISFWGLVLQLRPLGPLSSGLLVRGGNHFATFINKNHAAGFLSISLAAAIALTIWSFARIQDDPGRLSGPNALLKTRRTSGQRRGLAWTAQAALQGLTGWQLFSLLMVAVISAGIVCSLSRGAWVATLAAAAVTANTAGVGRQARWRWAVLLIAAGGGLALVLWMGKGALLGARWNTLWTQLESPDGRLHHWRDALVTIGEFWRLGSGLGTYRFVYLLNSTTPRTVWFYHAENQYLEAAVEGGWLGVGLLVTLIGLAALACRRLLAEPPTTLSYALGVGALFALLSQVVHSAFDFGLYVPANMALFALLMGSACGLAAQLTARHEALARRDSPGAVRRASHSLALKFWHHLGALPSTLLTLRLNKVTAAIGVALLLVALAMACVDTGRAAIIEAAGHPIDVAALSGTVPPATELVNIDQLARATVARPDDAEAQQKLAELWILSGRTKLVLKWKKSWGQATDLETLWTRTAPVELHAWAALLRTQHQEWELDTLRKSEEIQDDFTRAAQHLLRAREACPILPETHLRLGELALLVPSLGDEAGHLQRMRDLIGHDDRLLMEAGFVEYQSGRVDQALADWKRVAAHAPQQFLPQILDYALQSPALTSEIEKLLPDDPACLVELTNSRFRGPESVAVRERLLSRASELLRSTVMTPQRHYLEGMILALREDGSPAIEQLTKAVELRPDQLNWRYELALVLQKTGNLTAAHEQASLCWSQEPSNERYERLFRQLVRMQLTTR